MSGDDDVFDEDLVRELGLDPEDLNGPKVEKKRKPIRKPAAQAPTRPAQGAPAPQNQVAPEPPVAKPRPAAPKAPASAAPQKEPQPTKDTSFEEQATRVSKDIPVQLAAVLAKKSLKLKNVLEFKAGEVVEFNKQPQDLLDLVANGKLIAKAELVMVDGQLGARIVKLIK